MSLAAMIAKQKAEQERKANESSKPAADNGSAAVAPESVAPAAPAGGAKLKFGIKKQGEGNGNGGTKVPAAHPGPSDPESVDKPVAAATVADKPSGVLTLDDLENSLDAGIESTDRSIESKFVFDDEIPSTAPTRELPAELTAGMEAFVGSLNSIYEIVHDPDLFGQMIRTIMQEMQENPDYTQLLADQDVHTMIRGLRQSMGLAKIKKAEKTTKTRASTKKATPATAIAGTADSMFNDADW